MPYVYLYRLLSSPVGAVEVSEPFPSHAEATMSLYEAQTQGNVGGGYVMPLSEARELYPDLFGR